MPWTNAPNLDNEKNTFPRAPDSVDKAVHMTSCLFFGPEKSVQYTAGSHGND